MGVCQASQALVLLPHGAARELEHVPPSNTPEACKHTSTWPGAAPHKATSIPLVRQCTACTRERNNRGRKQYPLE